LTVRFTVRGSGAAVTVLRVTAGREPWPSSLGGLAAGDFVAGRLAAGERLAFAEGLARRRRSSILTGGGLARPAWQLVVYALQARQHLFRHRPD